MAIGLLSLALAVSSKPLALISLRLQGSSLRREPNAPPAVDAFRPAALAVVRFALTPGQGAPSTESNCSAGVRGHETLSNDSTQKMPGQVARPERPLPSGRGPRHGVAQST